MAAAPVAPVAELGLRGWRRQEALTTSPLFRLFDPFLRWLAAFSRRLPWGGIRFKANRKLMWAGDFMGFDADGWFALILLGGLIGAAAGILLINATSLKLPLPPVVMAAAMFGLFICYTAVGEAMTSRRRAVNRNLPGAMDIIALCLSAGMTFPQAIREFVERAVNQRDPLIEELRHVLRQLSLGHGHRHALDLLAVRVPIDSVRDFVGAVEQSEQKGTPLAQVLTSQSSILRMRRSVLAEEAAARSGAMMVIPLTLVLAVNLVFLAGPLLLKGLGL
jgi:tight adherence protein C